MRVREELPEEMTFELSPDNRRVPPLTQPPAIPPGGRMFNQKEEQGLSLR